MPLKIQSKKGTATTSKQIVDNKEKAVLSEDVQDEKVETPVDDKAEGPFCEVGVDASYTHNLGNYQSAKVGVSLRVPCTHGEIDDVFEYAQTWVDAKMQTMMADLQSDE